ncbi:MAG TPA: protein-glutamate O-methyltransferase CheR [Spirochaetota bacterium]|nr:protein-glutamate O-methyltransferase CheR [Spirochaetota bacterium]HOS33386.1 protein-glutamate O-methyltransferase CheR [Spirochaetota bacterium]HOS56825.1 protein-glutamate O-methyltransferase CheR [Spirochaetota bacterium]HQF78912.1 protein-glutamate O-methyltransferase CheR [Spirochaetota bacterium]HQH30582.1 protein-glutamate O-methyltransferase CheR [Spirochaetota bacterium]
MKEILSDALFSKFADFFYSKTGIKLKEYKKYLIINRLSKFIGSDKKYLTFKDFYDALVSTDDPDFINSFVNAITTNFSFFFRERVHFDFLRYFFSKFDFKNNYARIWSAACSTGEETYSAAISVLQTVDNLANYDFKILGTDISTRVLSDAERGGYNADKLDSNVDKRLLKTYFDKVNNNYIVKDFVKKFIDFRYLNLMKSYPFTREFDIVFLRNVLIYFDPGEKEYIINRIYPYVKKGGYLILGLSETLLGIKHNFKTLKYSIYKKE